MKKIFIIIAAFTLIFASNSFTQTILLSEGFNNETCPSGWAVDDVTSEGVLNFVTTSTYPDYNPYTCPEGTHMVHFNSRNGDNWQKRLKTATTISTVGKTDIKIAFKWLQCDDYPTQNDYVIVQYSTNGSDWTDVKSVNRVINLTNPPYVSKVWTDTTIVLPTAAENQANLQIAFLFCSKNGEDTYIDDVRLIATSASALEITPLSKNVAAAAGSFDYTITSAAAWTATSNQTWCTVTPSGTGNGTLTATYEANADTAGRTATITITSDGINATATLTQAGSPITLAVSPTTFNPTSVAGTQNLTVTSNTTWTVSSNKSWCTLDVTLTGGSNNGTVVATYTANTGSTPRTGAITFKAIGHADIIVNFIQSADTNIAIYPATQNVLALAGTFDFSVVSNAPWTATSDQTWCTVTPSGAGSGTLTATYEANTGAVRTATITATITAKAGTKTATATLVQSTTTGIAEETMQMLIYPNPSEDIFNIQIAGSNNIEVIDILGNIIKEDVFNNNYKLDLSSNAAGTYFIKVSSAEKTLTQKIILK